MSSIYNLEPQPTASAIIHTTLGDLSVELFAKQTPLTCRNFLQLALDGYYDNTIFHRLVPGFILQGGDPTGTGNGGESIYDGGALSGDLDPWPMDQRRGKNAGSSGVNFRDEFHSRLKFNRRGLLGMANEGEPDSNGTQFFFTLDKTEELNGKNTVFGRVAGDTIYNLAKIGEAELEEGSDRPLYPIKVTQIEVLINPFEDMRKRERPRHSAEASTLTKSASEPKKKRKGGKKLLSFADDGDDGDDDLPLPKKAKFDTRVVMDVNDELPSQPKPVKPKKGKEKDTGTKRPSPEAVAEPREVDMPVRQQQMGVAAADEQEDIQSTPSPPPKKSLLERTNEEIAALKASMKRTVYTEPVKEQKKLSALEQLIPDTSTRARKRRPGIVNTTAQQDQKALDLLQAFKSRLEHAPPKKHAAAAPAENQDGKAATEPENEEEVCDLHFIANCQSCQSWDKREAKEDSDDEGWMSHSLSFAADKLGKDLSYRKKAEDELIVIDPREKARNLKEEKRAEREARAGGSGRAWDQARNSQLSKAAALAGEAPDDGAGQLSLISL